MPFSGHLIVMQASPVGHHQAPPPISNIDVQGLMRNLPSAIDRVVPFVQKPMFLHTQEGVVEGVYCKGVDLSGSYHLLKPYICLGELPTDDNKGAEVMISMDLAQRLNLKLYDFLLLSTLGLPPHYRKLKIGAIYCTHLHQEEASLLFCDIGLMQQLNRWGPDQVSGYDIYLHKDTQATQLLRNQILDQIDPMLGVRRMDQRYFAIDHFLAVMHTHTLLFMVFVWVISAGVFICTAIIQVVEQKHMMALFQVLGAAPGQIFGIFFIHGLYRLMPGIFVGAFISIGLVVGQLYYGWIELEPSIYYVDRLPIYFNGVGLLGLGISSLVLGGMVLWISLVLLIRKGGIDQ